MPTGEAHNGKGWHRVVATTTKAHKREACKGNGWHRTDDVNKQHVTHRETHCHRCFIPRRLSTHTIDANTHKDARNFAYVSVALAGQPVTL